MAITDLAATLSLAQLQLVQFVTAVFPGGVFFSFGERTTVWVYPNRYRTKYKMVFDFHQNKCYVELLINSKAYPCVSPK